MNRFTKKTKNGYKSTCNYLSENPFVRARVLDEAWNRERNKLGQLEDIEEKRGLNLSSIDQALEIIMRDPDAVFNTIDLYNDWEEYDEDCINENVTTYPFKSKEEFDLLKEIVKSYVSNNQ